MKKRSTQVKTWILLLLVSFALQSCFLRGDPRKNCNHPQHGNYMREQQIKRNGF